MHTERIAFDPDFFDEIKPKLDLYFVRVILCREESARERTLNMTKRMHRPAIFIVCVEKKSMVR